MLGHFIYGRTIRESDRLRTSWGLGIGEYGIETGALEAGYIFTLDLAAKFDVLLTDSMVMRIRPRYDISIGSLPGEVGPVEESDLATPHFFALDVMLLTSSRFYFGLEYWKILPRNSDANPLIAFLQPDAPLRLIRRRGAGDGRPTFGPRRADARRPQVLQRRRLVGSIHAGRCAIAPSRRPDAGSGLLVGQAALHSRVRATSH